jgi:hypothetical protein
VLCCVVLCCVVLCCVVLCCVNNLIAVMCALLDSSLIYTLEAPSGWALRLFMVNQYIQYNRQIQLINHLIGPPPLLSSAR